MAALERIGWRIKRQSASSGKQDRIDGLCAPVG